MKAKTTGRLISSKEQDKNNETRIEDLDDVTLLDHNLSDKLLYKLQLDDSAPLVLFNTYIESSYKYTKHWKRAFFKIKARRAIEKLKGDVILYGTSFDRSELDKTKISISQAIQLKYTSFHKQKIKDPDFPRYLIHPESKFKHIWNVCMILLLIYTALIMPFRVAFMENVYWDAWTLLETAMDFLFIFDILINLVSSYPTSEGQYEIRLRTIIWKYGKSWMFLDIFASIPFALIEASEDSAKDYGGNYNDVLRLIRLPRLYRLLRVSKLLKVISGKFFEKLQDWLGINTPKAKLYVFVITVSVIIHVVACFWYYAAKLQGYGPESWVVSYGILDKGNGTKYLCAVYWAVTTLGTIGYGDITPQNDLERLVAIFWMLFGVGFYTYTIGSLSSLISSIDSREFALTQKLHMINTFASETGISNDLRRSLRNAIKYSASATGMSWSDKIELFAELPKTLRYKIAVNMYHKAAKKISFLKDKDPSFIADVMSLLNPTQVKNDDLIYNEGEYADEMFFIVKGRVNLVYGDYEFVYKSYLKGAYFGEIEIIKKIGRLDKIKSFGMCEMLVLKKDVLNNILEKHPKEAEKFIKVANEREVRHCISKQKLREILCDKLASYRILKL